MGVNIDAYLLIVLLFIASFIFVLLDTIINFAHYKNLYNKSSFKAVTNYSFFRVMCNKKLMRQGEMFESLEKNCMTGHILNDLKIRDDKGDVIKLDLCMIDKFGISIFDIIEDDGTISGDSNMPFWRMKKGLMTYKIPNYSLVMNRKIDVLCNALKITDKNIINAYLIFDNKAKFKNVKLDNKNLKIVKRPYVNGALCYEQNHITRQISDSEVMAYTILLEKYANLPLFMRDEKLLLKDYKTIDNDFRPNRAYQFEFVKQLTSYTDLKKLWEVMCKCDKDVYPPFSLRRDDVLDIPFYARDMLLPNIYYKDIIHKSMVIVRKDSQIIGFLSVDLNKVLKISEELGRVNLLDTACVLKEHRKEGIIRDLYAFCEERLPEEYGLKYILAKSSSRNDSHNKLLRELGYKEKVIVDTKNKYGDSTIYFFKKTK